MTATKPLDSTKLTYTDNRAAFLSAQGRYDEAWELTQESISSARQLNDPGGLCSLQRRAITIAAALGRHEEAVAILDEVVARTNTIFSDNAAGRVGTDMIIGLAICSGFASLVALNRVEEAERRLLHSIERIQGTFSEGLQLPVMATLWGHHCLNQLKPESAITLLQSVLAMPHSTFDEEHRPRLYWLLARCLLESNQRAQAQSIVNSATAFPWSPRGREQMEKLLQTL